MCCQFAVILFILFYALPLYSSDSVLAELIGHWSGVSGSSRINQSAVIGAGFAKKDIGHKVESFEFDVASNGHITGHGVAFYWFNVSGTVPFAAANAHLDGNVRRVEFTIDGKVGGKGVFITSETAEKLPLVGPGKRQTIDAWNVFGPEPAKLDKGPDGLLLSSSVTNNQIGMTVEWKAKKEGLEIYAVETPSPNHSFVSSDVILFRARVLNKPQFDAQIDWKSEDGKKDKILSGVLNPLELKDSADYSRTPALKPNPPTAPDGRNGKLSYKVTAYLDEKVGEQASIIIEQDELDRLRQEYVDMMKRRVPQRNEFTQNGGQFNTGDYDWAIVKQEALDGYNIAVQAFAPNITGLNSAYRNPVHNARLPGSGKESRHIYGDALDFQTPSIGHTGPPNKNDWNILMKAAEKAKPAYTEPYDQSGAGHVHIDWR